MIRLAHTNIGICIRPMPGARRLRMVVMMLIAPMIELMPRMWMAKMVMSMPMPIWVDSGAYMVQPVAAAPPGTANDSSSSAAAGGNSQKLQLFMRANAMSGAPIISGIIQFASPVKAGMMAPNTMTRPCMVVNWLNSSGSSSRMPGRNSSARIASAITPPDRNMANANHRYSVPMSLWLVANSQRRQPCGCPA